ncbi:MAG TPA: radical SAM family heme chaperone HemW [Gemmatimonadales bacterium]
MHLYIHAPFCARRCSYCDFAIAVRKNVPVQQYVDCIRREMEMASLADSSTIYFGGGTPSLLPAAAIAAILPAHGDCEVTLEANPDDVTPDKAAAWRAAGVNRISLGAQSFSDKALQWMHRTHDATRIGAAVETLKRAGITNISLDLIFALPVELERDWPRDLDRAIALAPAHLSLYGLTVEARTPLARWISRGASSAPDDDRYADEYLLAHERLAAAGYHFYEVSNAARDGHRSQHNSAYWSGRPYTGLGPAAHSFDGHTRRWNLAAWEAYRRAITAGRSPVESEELLTSAQRRIEDIYLALRTERGLDATVCPPDRVAAWRHAGWITVRDGRVVCTPEGWLRLDALVRDLTGAPEAA